MGAGTTTPVINPTVMSADSGTGFILGPIPGVQVVGNGFGAGATVTINGVACTSVVVNSATLITCTTGTIGAEGFGDVVVTNTNGGVGTLANGWLALASGGYYRSQPGDYVLDGASKVATWTDKSGGGNDLVSSGFNAGPTIATNVFGTRPGLHWTAAFSQDLRKTAFATSATACEAYMVKKNQAGPGTDVLVCQTGALLNVTTEHTPYINGAVYSCFGAANTVNTGAPSPAVTWTAGHLLHTISTSAEFTAACNSDAAYFTTATNTVGWPTIFMLGGNTSGFFDGYLGLVVWFPRKLTAPERARVKASIKTDWSTP